MITLWGRDSAYNVQKVLWLLDELQLPFKHLDVGSTPGDLESAEFLQMNPNARIPVLQDGELLIWESNTILRYLAERYGGDEYGYRDAAQRSLTERWMDWELASLQPDFLTLFWSYFRTPEADRDETKINAAQQRYERLLGILNQQLEEHRFVAGGTFSLADVCAGTALYRYFNMGLPTYQPQFLCAWYQQLCQRPAYQQRIMVPFESLRGRLQF